MLRSGVSAPGNPQNLGTPWDFLGFWCKGSSLWSNSHWVALGSVICGEASSCHLPWGWKKCHPLCHPLWLGDDLRMAYDSSTWTFPNCFKVWILLFYPFRGWWDLACNVWFLPNWRNFGRKVRQLAVGYSPRSFLIWVADCLEGHSPMTL